MSNDSLATSTTAPSAQGGGSPVVVNMYKRWGDDGAGMSAEWTVLELAALDANHLRSAISSAVAPNGFATKVYAKFPRTSRTVALQHRLRGGGPGSPIRECGEDAEPEPAVERLDAWPTDTPMADPPIAALAPGLKSDAALGALRSGVAVSFSERTGSGLQNLPDVPFIVH